VPAIDGATFIDENLQVVGFSAMLPTVPASHIEDHERGARHNAALRFSAGKSDVFILVLSEDGPMSIVYEGEYTNVEDLGVAESDP
jgi:DNA integrity scanning protein DisA with diadenylate cyclase activity